MHAYACYTGARHMGLERQIMWLLTHHTLPLPGLAILSKDSRLGIYDMNIILAFFFTSLPMLDEPVHNEHHIDTL